MLNKYKRSLITGAAMLGALSLGACATTPGSSVPTIDPAVISQVQNTTAQVCGFVPTVQTVQSIAASFFTDGSLINSVVTQVENAICAAVKPKASARRMVSRPMVNGVPVEGYFLAK